MTIWQRRQQRDGIVTCAGISGSASVRSGRESGYETMTSQLPLVLKLRARILLRQPCRALRGATPPSFLLPTMAQHWVIYSIPG